MVASSFWLPEQMSTIAERVDADWDLVFWISTFFFFLVVGLMFYFVFRYRSKPGGKASSNVTHHTALEVFWTVIPCLLVVVLFWQSYKTYLHMTVPPDGAYEIQVTGQKWNWLFTYPNGWVDGDLHVWVGEPVTLILSSEDVIHALYVPESRLKLDVVPGRYRKMWFEPTKAGEFDIYCAEYCGTEHSSMMSKLVVHESRDAFDVWMADASNLHDKFPPAEVGALLYNKFGCKQCHSIDGTAGIAPTFTGLYGSRETLTTGESILVDENYVRESILEPKAKVTAGFDPVMPTFQGRFNDDDINAIIAYLKTLEQE
ncbi:MAG: cytochrome c oxidase subunit II [Acidobacteriota bacterium]|nr:cytochrome c oxidase subunit II [Acidobacteriota bacterium]MDH3784041.1 cytochrome c oxidase subunit II [Acidobacteriota bacterium]